MATIINADTSTGGAIITGDGSGVLALQTGGVTAVTVSAAQAVTFANALVSPTLTTAAMTNPTITNYVETPYTANTSTAITLNLANGTVQILTLTGSPTITMPALVSGKSFVIYLKTGAGSYTVTWSTVKWPGGTAPTITSAASKMDIYSFYCDGTNWYGATVSQNYTP